MKTTIRIRNEKTGLIFILSCMMLIAAVTGMAQEVKKVGTASAAFLKIPVGARGSAMGSAFVASADDPSALYWNPGGLSRNEHRALVVDHSPWLPGLSYNFLGVVVPIQGTGTLGIGVTALTTQEMDVTTPANPMGTGEKFDASSIAVGFSFARSLTDRFSIGGTFKYITERIFNCKATGIAFDVGTLYDTPLSGLRLGVSVSNFGSKMRIDGEDLNVRVDIAPDQLGNNQSVVGRLKTERFDLPLIMRLGLSYDAIHSQNLRLTVAADGVNPSDNAQSINLGAELAFLNERLVLRGGYSELFLEDNEKGLTFGAGVKTNIASNVKLEAGYAFQSFVHLSNANRITLTLLF